MFIEGTIKGKIKAGENGEYFYISDYIPKNAHGRLNANACRYSDLIIGYKNGEPSVVVYFAELLKILVPRYFNGFDLILPVPPSDTFLDSFPNSAACRMLSLSGAIYTLDNAIRFSKGHKPGHLGGSGAKKIWLEYLGINEKYDFGSKRIIIFDDVITSGATFRHIRNILYKKRAGFVTGLFLGKTVRENCGI